MYRLCTLLLLSAVACFSASVQTFYSESAFDDAVRSGSFTTESFSGNQINTPGLTMTLCGTPDFAPTSCVGPNINLFNLTSVNLSGNQVQGTVGFFEGVYFTDSFTLPRSVTAIGFDFTGKSGITPAPTFATPISYILGSQSVSPFGNIVDPNPSPFNYPYDGFLGFVSDESFNTLTLGGAGVNGGDVFTLDNLTFGDPTPEPGTFGLIGLAGVGLALIRSEVRCGVRHASARWLPGYSWVAWISNRL